MLYSKINKLTGNLPCLCIANVGQLLYGSRAKLQTESTNSSFINNLLHVSLYVRPPISTYFFFGW